ncbi:MAG: tRNA pseudouridine(55) synthase TruB [Bacteroidales bacterium]|jgi:tRNA pseudouridine55 synthase|nr:tRNA pseudouridine(55) synthase TruB [Bacteroidales bacterium]
MIIDKNIHTISGIDFQEGHVVLIDKQKDWTSFDVVNKIRYMIKKTCSLPKIKVGHGGTLDPQATGLLILGIGRETKNLSSYQNESKEYIADITFGAETPSYDSETEPCATYSTADVSEEIIQHCLDTQFSGEIMQTPPIYSAKIINGVRAYKSAREGEEVTMTAVPVTIYEHELIGYSENTARIRFVCSKGTYIRSLAYDIGKALNSGAFLSSLRRTKSGGFDIQQCIAIKDFEQLLHTL